MTVDLSVDLGRGLRLANPVGLASGTAGFGFELEQLIDLGAVGALYTKGTTRHPRAGNAPPRVAETAGGMLNSIGLQNPGVEHVAAAYAPHFARWGCAVIANIAGAEVDEYVDCVRILERAEGVDGYELNISCPNIAHGLDLGRDPDQAARVTAAVRRVTERCLVVKLSPNVTDIGAIAVAAESAGADAVSAVNTYVGMKIHRHAQRPVLPGAGTGGLSGPAIKPLALAAVAAVRRAVSIPVIAAGGITDTGDAVDFLVAGADAVQVGTATFTDPSAAVRIVSGLHDHLAAAGLTRATELRWH
ncbi:MAG TPA: dihydroorotate dehydrogenase, partial [Candidatus Dormibacteraeota bacterium]|nr:dihydroorotate dehydrogenase [Candidatus Dormibacteraeota bacterium]